MTEKEELLELLLKEVIKMPTAKEIKANYKAQHDTLSESYYNGSSGLTKEQFDSQHGQVWDDMEAEIQTASDYVEPIPPRDLEAEIDTLKIKLVALELKVG